MLKFGNGWMRATRRLLAVCIGAAWFTRYGGAEWHAWPGLLAAVVGLALLFASPRYVPAAIYATTAAASLSGALLATDVWWGAAWLQRTHYALAMLLAALIALLAITRMLRRDAQLDTLVAALVQHVRRVR